jgi:hypothetical protein
MRCIKQCRNRKGKRDKGRGNPSLKINAWLSAKKEVTMTVREACVYWDSYDDILRKGNSISVWLKYRRAFYHNNPCFKKAKGCNYV